ncbi:molybdate ABC transporter substrate-binding protein [Methanoplanus sp. FWC-SCC4]|uniref:Molybdate ABC transporter substrate-binding protein n=1 Tax=Methanochimaera problematica TaxID=2609417 RepID=A0AA97I276_9EURY|nr:molybdate ABC transporter substrate-binding protein [Methanoplanus sp. FWC-SCC4]WOF15328.1 molybdate ABC transporter substrate-binding protein [Methanoplanus sp. FWC-SCC4]
MKKIISGLIVILVFAGLILASGCTSNAADTDVQTPAVTGASEKSLVVYCGAGLREPMEKIADAFKEKEGILIKYTYGGSAQLLSQIELLQEGDVYMPGARAYIESAAKKGFIDDSRDVVYHVLAIATKKGNPKDIRTLKDLTKEGVKVGIGEPEGNAVGKASKSVLTKNGLWEDIQDNIAVRSGTVNELLVYLNMDQVDAVIIWEDLLDTEKMDVVDIPVEEGFVKVVPVGKLTFSEQPDDAMKFVEFVASDDGKALYRECGFETYPSDKYENL